ncbi:MAG: bifunctional precorrin-2 dehydrogenase/sirohydrochlorin ferrochelatase [Gemmatimonadota bacterium]|nr:MAG: bifunctional precorrin-2 dehydrogenase/sirohydrochlorin ferrochelatase [Gemmatimonadota bacterium]
MRFLPLGIDLNGKRCVVLGGGAVGTRKVLTLLQAGAVVTVVSPDVTEELAAEISEGRVSWVKDDYKEGHLDDAFLAVCATSDAELNAAIATTAREGGTLVCNASSAQHSQVIFGALCEVDDGTVAVFTDGDSPARARQTRDRIAVLLDRGQTRK